MCPITLLEFGQVVESMPDLNYVIVCCEKGFWRRGNIEVICRDYNIILFETIEDAKSDMFETIDILTSRRENFNNFSN